MGNQRIPESVREFKVELGKAIAGGQRRKTQLPGEKEADWHLRLAAEFLASHVDGFNALAHAARQALQSWGAQSLKAEQAVGVWMQYADYDHGHTGLPVFIRTLPGTYFDVLKRKAEAAPQSEFKKLMDILCQLGTAK